MSFLLFRPPGRSNLVPRSHPLSLSNRLSLSYRPYSHSYRPYSQKVTKLTGAESMVRTLVDGGVNVCFANPGTSEMHFVAALDKSSGMNPVLCLFEGVATGAADGYARMMDKPAATLLHLGPGFGNAFSCLHNAIKASSPIINIIGEHASYHLGRQAPLELTHGQIEDLTRPVSSWVRRVTSAESISNDTAEALKEAMSPPGNVASLICPADYSWNHVTKPPGKTPEIKPRPYGSPCPEVISKTAAILRQHGPKSGILVAGRALRADTLATAGRIATATGCRIFGDLYKNRHQGGAGRYSILGVPYYPEEITKTFSDVKNLFLCGARAPVAFFAYPGRPTDLLPPECHAHLLCSNTTDPVATLNALAEELKCTKGDYPRQKLIRPPLPTGPITVDGVARAVAHLLPEGAIVVSETMMGGGPLEQHMPGSQPHDWLFAPMGGSIGQGIPVATGAAIACPDRLVVTLQSDGSAMYTIQGLWTQAREKLNVITIIYSNRRYGILDTELRRVSVESEDSGTGHGDKAEKMLSIGHPDLNFVKIAEGLGVPAMLAKTGEEFVDLFQKCMKNKGPSLIQVDF